MTKGIVSFTTNPYVFTTLDRARPTSGARRHSVPTSAAISWSRPRPGADLKALLRRIRARMPELDVYDRRTYSWMCMEFWLTRTGIGISFGLAAPLGLLVGLAVVAQTLYASVTERIKEFGTLKAMGADDRTVSYFLVSQALGNAELWHRVRPPGFGGHQPGDELAACPRRFNAPCGRGQRRAHDCGLPRRRLVALLADPEDRSRQYHARWLRSAVAGPGRVSKGSTLELSG